LTLQLDGFKSAKMMKRFNNVANTENQKKISRYPWLTQITFNGSSEFIGQDFQTMIKNDYGIQGKLIMVKNPQANAIVE
jgi:hypothetical protein